MAMVAFAGCGDGEQEQARSHPAAPSLPGLYSVGARIFGLPGGPVRLAEPPVTPLAGWLTPAAVPSADGRYLAYNSWRELRHDDPNLSWPDQGIEPGDARGGDPQGLLERDLPWGDVENGETFHPPL
jgi:hypothetical protein